MKRILLWGLLALFLCPNAEAGTRTTVTKDSAGTMSNVTAYVTESGTTVWEVTAAGVSIYANTYNNMGFIEAPNGYVAVYNTDSNVSGYPTLSGVSITDGTITDAKISEPLDVEIAAIDTDNTILGRTYFCELTNASTSLSGKTVYGGWIGNWGSTSEVTGVMPEASKGMTVVFELTQGQVSGSTLIVSFNPLDTVVGLTSGFSSGDSVVYLSSVTMESSMVLEGRMDNYWFVSSVTGENYRNK